MTTPNGTTARDFAARRRASQEAITADFLKFIDEESLREAAQALDAARHEANHGTPTADTLMRVAEATIAASRILDAAAKACAAQAVDAGNPLRDAARRLRIGNATITQGDDTVVSTPNDAWWRQKASDNDHDGLATDNIPVPETPDLPQEQPSEAPGPQERGEQGEQRDEHQEPQAPTPQPTSPNPHAF